jgi:hypothetical protein
VTRLHARAGGGMMILYPGGGLPAPAPCITRRTPLLHLAENLRAVSVVDAIEAIGGRGRRSGGSSEAPPRRSRPSRTSRPSTATGAPADERGQEGRRGRYAAAAARWLARNGADALLGQGALLGAFAREPSSPNAQPEEAQR